MLERYALAKSSGFRAVECAFPYDFPKEEIAAAKENLGLEQILINTYPGANLGFAALENHQPQFMESLNRSIEYCQALKCSRLHIMSGKVSGDVQGSEEVLKDNLIKALPLLEQAGIVGLIEPINPYWVPNYFLNDFNVGQRLVQEINHPNLMLMLDIFHLQYLLGNLGNNVSKLLPFSGHVQIAQVPDRHEPNSEGENNYKYILQILERSNYQGWIGLEYIPQKGTDEGLRWVEEYGYSL